MSRGCPVTRASTASRWDHCRLSCHGVLGTSLCIIGSINFKDLHSQKEHIEFYKIPRIEYLLNAWICEQSPDAHKSLHDCQIRIVTNSVSGPGLHFTGKPSAWKAIRCSMNSNGQELERAIHSHHISHRSVWPSGFSASYPNRQSWIFTIVSVGSSLLYYLFTSATVPIPVHTTPNDWLGKQ